MSKAANNEKIKLKAAFYNNVGVGAALGGAYIPLVNLYQGSASPLKELTSGTFNPDAFMALLGMLLFLGTGYLLRQYALNLLDDIKD